MNAAHQDDGSAAHQDPAHQGAAHQADDSGRHLDRAGMMRRWPTVLGLVVVWIALWGQLSVANVLGGLIVALAVLTVARQFKPRPVEHLDVVAALRYAVTFVRQLVMASYQVALAVLWPERIRPGILAMPLHHASDAVVTLVANSITLTPGTLTLEAERRGDVTVLYVHALDVTDVDAVRADVDELEKLAVDAFGGPRAQAAQEGGPAAHRHSTDEHPADEHPADGPDAPGRAAGGAPGTLPVTDPEDNTA